MENTSTNTVKFRQYDQITFWFNTKTHHSHILFFCVNLDKCTFTGTAHGIRKKTRSKVCPRGNSLLESKTQVQII